VNIPYFSVYRLVAKPSESKHAFDRLGTKENFSKKDSFGREANSRSKK